MNKKQRVELRSLLVDLCSVETALENCVHSVQNIHFSVRRLLEQKPRKTKLGKPVDISAMGSAITKHLGEVSKILDAQSRLKIK